jgi:2-oxoglutarate dehydrogenase complex dehydrogenase (E1) component-like enzyme
VLAVAVLQAFEVNRVARYAHGYNENDDSSFTQALMYERIKRANFPGAAVDDRWRELYQQPFIPGWIDDLTATDPVYR